MSALSESGLNADAMAWVLISKASGIGGLDVNNTSTENSAGILIREESNV